VTLPPTVDLAARDTVRLVSTGRRKDPVLRPLAASDEGLDQLAALESATNARLMAERSGLDDLDPRELVFGRPNATFINAAFTHTRPGGNRFNAEDRGAWNCAFEVETALAEVAWHLARELTAIGRFENSTDYAALIADFIGTFHDLRGMDRAAEPALHRDPAIAYPAGQALAKRLRADVASNGIVYLSARREAGTCLAAFHPGLVQNLRQGDIWRLAWAGSPTPAITRVGG